MLDIHVIKGRGNKIAYKSLKQLPAKTRRGIQKAFLQERTELKKDTVASMKEKKTGRDYFVYVGRGGRRLKRGRWHKASRKGESPAILTGALSKSLGFQIKNGRKLTYGANTPYARRHEIEGRSYLLRTIQKDRNEIGYRIQSFVKKELSK